MEEILGKGLPELFPGGPGALYRLNVASVATSGTIKNNVSRLQLPDGEVWYDTRLIPVSTQGGTCRYVMGVARDITASKQAEEVSWRWAERFRSAFDESPIGTAVCDSGGLLLHANQACLELFGIACPDSVRGINLLQVCRTIGIPDMRLPEDAGAPFKCLLDFDRIRSLDLLPTTRTGTIHIGGTISPLRSPDNGSLDGYLIQIHDITSHVLAEGAFQESNERLADIARHLPDAMFVIDRKGVVATWNLAMEKLTGIPAKEMLGKGNYEYALPFYGKRTPMLVDKVLKPNEMLRNRYCSVTRLEGNGITAEAVIQPRNGDSSRMLCGKAALLYGRQGEVTGAFESIREITELRGGDGPGIPEEEVIASSLTESSTTPPL